MKLIFTKAAVHDLIRLREFIAQHNPAAAQRISQRLRGAVDNLLESPQIGRPVDMPGEVRELIFGKYIVRYQINQNTLCILRVWHGREDR